MIEKILTHFRFQARAPPRALACGRYLQRRPEATQPWQFRQPGDQDRWGRLRPRVFATHAGGPKARDNPLTAPKGDASSPARLGLTLIAVSSLW